MGNRGLGAKKAFSSEGADLKCHYDYKFKTQQTKYLHKEAPDRRGKT